MKTVTDKLKNFLQYVAVKLIDEPSQAQLKVAEVGPKRLRFKLVLAQADVAMLIGRNGFTASSIRSVLKAAAEREGVQVSLQIHSHEEEAEHLRKSIVDLGYEASITVSYTNHSNMPHAGPDFYDVGYIALDD